MKFYYRLRIRRGLEDWAPFYFVYCLAYLLAC